MIILEKCGKPAIKILANSRFFILQDRKGLKTTPFIMEKEIPYIDPEIFMDETIKLMINLKSSFTKIKQFNDEAIKQINLFYSPHPTLQVQTEIGQIKVEGNIESSTLYYSSPISGVYKYYYDVGNRRWFSNKDQHIFQENICREMMYKFRGVFQL